MENQKDKKDDLDIEIIPNGGEDVSETSSLKNPTKITPSTTNTPTTKEEDLYTPDKTIEINGDDIIESPEIPVDLTKPKEDEVIIDNKTNGTKKDFVIEPKTKDPLFVSPEQNKPISISPEPQKQTNNTDLDLQKKQDQKVVSNLIEPEKKSIITPNKELGAVIKPEQKNTSQKKDEELEKKSLKEKTPLGILKEDSLPKENPTKTEKQEEPKENEERKSFIKTVRTYQDDVVKTMKEQKTSLTKMVIAEKKKQRGLNVEVKKREGEKGSKKTILTIGIILSLVITGSLAVYYFINETQPKTPPTVTELKIPTYIFPDYVREIFLTKLTENKIIENLESEKESVSIPLGSIIQLYLTREDGTKQFIIEETEGNKLLITTEVFFNTLEAKTSSSLTRSLSPDFMFGYHSSLGNNPFLLFKVKSYSNVFSGMLAWEKTMLEDLSPIFTKEGPDTENNKKEFQDIIISNKDVRAILDNKGKIKFAYAFPDKETLVIINNETTFKELLRRIINANLERN